ncbi:MAG: right-handed parallel beta-helix repeat-containing protein, partial [Ekhidna sp.]|nr:right-handed parallel beta-helix repeat-containing protein [Ekhidna sp.]
KGQLRPGGSGVEGKPIVISAYGEGSNPVIDGAAAEGGAFASAVYVENQDHLEISHLIVTNDRQSGRNGVADDQGYGIFLHNTGDRTMNHIRLRNLTVEHVYAFELDPEADFNSIDVAGILIRSEANQSEELARNINDVIIEDCYITRSGKFGVRLQHRNGDFGGDSLTRNSNIIIRNNHFHETGGSSILPGRVYNCLIENNIFDYPGSSADFRMPGRGSALWFFSSINGIAQHNISRHVRGPKDSYGYHIDFGNENIIYQYNYSEDAEGGFVEILGANKNIGYRYNVSVNDGLRSNARTFWMSGFAGSGRDPVKNEQAFVYNNTAYVGKQQHTDVHLENGELYIYNNVVFADEGAVIGEQVKISESEGFEVQNHNNLYFGDVRSAFAERDTAAVVGDPKFILAGDLDPNSYQLAEGSAALNGSSSLYPKLTFPMAGKGIFKDITEDPIVDFFGNPVDISAKPHLGAFNGPLGVQFVKAILSLSISQNSLKPGEQATITARIDRTLATNETVGIEVSDEIFSLYDLSNDTVFIPANANEGNVIISSKDTNEQLEENLDATISLFSPSTRLELGDSVNMAIQLINLQERVLGLQNAIKVSPFPNPASSQIEILGSKDVVDGVVYSTSGNKVILPMIGEGVFDVRALNEGVYLLLVKTIEGASRVGKLWIQRK